MYKYTKISILALLVAFAAVSGCKEAESNDSADDKAAAEQQADDKQADNSGSETVDVPKDGKEYDPSVKVDQLPEGAWHCNMNGKAHYAAMHEGDGECPVCGMDLKKAGE